MWIIVAGVIYLYNFIVNVILYDNIPVLQLQMINDEWEGRLSGGKFIG